MCYVPKLQWVNDIAIYQQDKFEIEQCNIGLNKCKGGCTSCMAAEGNFVSKSCVGENDIILQLLGINEDGCRNISENQNNIFIQWMNQSVGGNTHFSPNFRRGCRCSWNGCNGPYIFKLMNMPKAYFQMHASSKASFQFINESIWITSRTRKCHKIFISIAVLFVTIFIL